jgi:hypothetical protein
MNVLALLAFLFALAVFAVPGIFLAARLRWGETAIEQALIGATLGLACAAYLGWAVSYLDLRLMAGVWPGFGVAVFGWWKTTSRLSAAQLSSPSPGTPGEGRGEGLRPNQQAKPERAQDPHPNPLPGYRERGQNGGVAVDRAEHRWLLLTLALVAVSRFAMAWGDRLPCGRDPAFHLILAQSLRVHHAMIFNWLPFENIPLNYPLGSHILVVLIATASRLSLVQSFNLLEPALGVLTTGLIYCLGKRLFPEGSIALFSAASYGLLAWYGSVGYYQWGGLPNELAMMFFLLILLVIAENSLGSWATWRLGLSFAALLVTHHHVLIAAGACLLALMIYFQLSHDSHRRQWLIARGVLLGMALANFYLVQELLKAHSIGATDVWSNDEHWIRWGELASDFGPAFFVAAIVGMIGSLVCRRMRAGGIVWTLCLALIALFIACEFGAPLLGKMIGHEPDMAFTPSRFLTDAVYFFAFFCGLAFSGIARLLSPRDSRRGFPIEPGIAVLAADFEGTKQEWIGGAIVLVAIVAAFAGCMPRWFGLTRRDEPVGFRDACEWIRANTDALTIVDSSPKIPYDFRIWTSYLCWRQSMPRTPIPVSEPRKLVPDREAYVFALLAGTAAPVPPSLMVVDIVPATGQTPTYSWLWRGPGGVHIDQIYPVLFPPPQHAPPPSSAPTSTASPRLPGSVRTTGPTGY